MANRFIRSLQRFHITCSFHRDSFIPQRFRSVLHHAHSDILQSHSCIPINQGNSLCDSRSYSHGLVNLVISEGKPKFETHETEPPKKEKWKTKKRLKMQRKREKQKRKSHNKRDPRCLGVKGKKKKQKFPNAEERIKYKIEKAKIKEALLIERLQRYEVRRQQGPVVEPQHLTGEERFYMKKMAQKRSNYVPVGRRGVFGGVILNMHLHWKKHETVKVICKPCKPGQVHQYAEEISRLSGGVPIHVIGDDTIIFYRGKNYVQPEVMSPIDTLSKKKALEKSKYEQSLESVRRFIAIAEKELELYYRHVALYGDPTERSPYSAYTSVRKPRKPNTYPKGFDSSSDLSSTDLSDVEYDSADQQVQNEHDSDGGVLSETESDIDDESLSGSDVLSEDKGASSSRESTASISGLSSPTECRRQFGKQRRAQRFSNSRSDFRF